MHVFVLAKCYENTLLTAIKYYKPCSHAIPLIEERLERERGCHNTWAPFSWEMRAFHITEVITEMGYMVFPATRLRKKERDGCIWL